MRDVQTLVGLNIISMAEGKQLGTVKSAVCDLKSGRLVGLVLEGEPPFGVAAQDLATLGTHAVMVSSEGVVKPLEELSALAEKSRSAHGQADVITSDGRRLGALGRIFIDPESKKVKQFEVSGGMWHDMTEGVLVMPHLSGIVHGGDVVIIPATAEVLSAGGIREQLEKVGEKVKAGVQQAAGRAEELLTTARDEKAAPSEAAPVKKAAIRKKAASAAKKPAAAATAAKPATKPPAKQK